MERYVTERRDDVSEPRELPAFVGIGHGPGDVANRAEEILEVELPTHLDPR